MPGPGVQEGDGAQGPVACEVRKLLGSGQEAGAEFTGSRRHVLHTPAGVGVGGAEEVF